MSYKQIVGTKRWRSYSSEKYDRACIEVEVLDHVNCPDSWYYQERDTESSITGQYRTWTDYHGKDLLHCAVRLKTKDGTVKKRFASLSRVIRSDAVDDSPVYQTSCKVLDRLHVRYSERQEGFVRQRHKDNHTSMWQLAGPDPISNEEQVSALLEEAHRLFEPRIPVSI